MPSGPPIYVRGYPVKMSAMLITWSKPKLLDCNGDILQYIVAVESGLDKHNYTYEVTNDCVGATTKLRCLSHSFSIPENQLLVHTKYSVKIAAVNVNGTGPFSNGITVMSGENGEAVAYNLLHIAILAQVSRRVTFTFCETTLKMLSHSRALECCLNNVLPTQVILMMNCQLFCPQNVDSTCHNAVQLHNHVLVQLLKSIIIIFFSNQIHEA